MNSVPFTIEMYGGLGQCEGIIRDEGEDLVLEFHISDTIAHVLKSGVRQVRVPLKELTAVTLTKGWLGTSWLGLKIVLQAAGLQVLKDVPGASQGRVELSVARKDRDAAERFVADLYESDQPAG